MRMETETAMYCSACRRHVKYRRINFVQNGYADWRLEVFCGCGEIRDPTILKLVREMYGYQIGREILAMQEAALTARIGAHANEWLNRRLARA